MSYLKDREIWLSNVPTGNPPTGYFWKFIQNGKVVVRDSSGNNQIMVATSGSQAITGSLTVTGGITGTVSSASYVEYSNVANKPALVSGSAQIAAFGYATTGSNGFNGSQSITGSLTVTGQVVAQTLNVQQVTSSIVYSSGSNIFGNSLANTQQFTGSVGVTGSLTVAGAGTFSSKVGVGGASATYPLTAYNASNGTTAAFGGTARGIRIDNDGTFSSGRSTIYGVDNTFYGSYQPLAIGGSELYFSISGTDKLTISSTGAATFSSSVTANSTINGYFGGITTGQTPATSGTTPVNPMLNLTNNRGIGMYFGGSYAGNYAQWIQVSDTGNLGVNYPLLLNPNGGNVGIGTPSPSCLFQARGSDSLSANSRNLKAHIGGAGTWGSNSFEELAIGYSGIRSTYTSNDNWDLSFTTGTSTTFAAGTQPERMRITSGGNVGIGTASPAQKLVVEGSESIVSIVDNRSFATGVGGALYLYGNYRSVGDVTVAGYIKGSKVNSTDGDYGFNLIFGTQTYTGGVSEKMRITSGGYLKAKGTESTYYGATLQYHELRTGVSAEWTTIFTNTSANPYGVRILYPSSAPNNSDNWFIYCDDSSTSARFRVASNGNVTNQNGSYGSVSDAKLKENIEDATPKLDDLMKVKVRNYNLIGDDKKQIGVIAQELQEVFPAMIDESPDKDKDGKNLGTTTKSVKYSIFVPMLIKAIQEQQALIESLKSRIEILEQ